MDVVHLFNTTRIHETAVQFDQAQPPGRAGGHQPHLALARGDETLLPPPLPPAVFPGHGLFCGEGGVVRPARRPADLRSRRVVRFAGTQRRVLAGARAVLPNSEVERRVLERESGVRAAENVRRALRLRPAGGRAAALAGAARTWCARAAIEPRKNQLAVIAAFKSLGRATPDRLLLYGSVERIARGLHGPGARGAGAPAGSNTAGCCPRRELHAAFGRAKAVVLASFFETFGLVALEAIACGAGVCVSDTGYTRGFFGDWVRYCDPFSAGSIRDGHRRRPRRTATGLRAAARAVFLGGKRHKKRLLPTSMPQEPSSFR